MAGFLEELKRRKRWYRFFSSADVGAKKQPSRPPKRGTRWNKASATSPSADDGGAKDAQARAMQQLETLLSKPGVLERAESLGNRQPSKAKRGGS